MSIKKRAVCVQTFSLGGKVLRCPKCGHMDVSKEENETRCPSCNELMEQVSDTNTEKDQSSTPAV